MKQVFIITAMDPNGVIGINGVLPWRYPADLSRFKNLTMGGTVVIGRKTFESLPTQGLPGRKIIVLSRSLRSPTKNAVFVPSLSSAISTISGPVWIAGGEEPYIEILKCGMADAAYVTLVPEIDVPANTTVSKFPKELLDNNFTLASESKKSELTFQLFLKKQ